jgi:Domain of unknown function (DUF4160)
MVAIVGRWLVVGIAGLTALYNGIARGMPTILYVQGWRFHFYSNEGNEPMHVHAVKGDAECKYLVAA